MFRTISSSPAQTQFGWRLWVSAIAAILLFAAASKFIAVLLSNQLFAIPPTILVGTAIVEAVVATYILLWGWKSVVSWFLLIAIFSVFAGYQIYLLKIKATSCDCFGFATPPFVMLALDIAISIVSIAMIPPRFCGEIKAIISPVWKVHNPHLFGVALFLVFTVAATIGAPVLVNSTRQHRIDVGIDQVPIDLGEVAASEWREVSVRVFNRSARSVVIAGGSSDCSCIAIAELPKELKSGDSTIVPVRIRFPERAGPFSREFRFAVSDGTYFTISGTIVGIVRANSSI